MTPHALHSRLRALVIGVAVALCVVGAVFLLFPSQSQVPAGKDYGYVYSGVKSSSVDFATAAMDEQSLLLFGSSELSTPRRLVPQVPAAVFGDTDYGLHLMLVGEAFDQSLWHAIALGAYGQAGIPQNKAVIIVSPGWFTDGGQDADTFQTRFSYSLYQRFCDNGQIPEQARTYVRTRLSEMGVSDEQLDAASPALPQDHLNGIVFRALDDLKLRQGLLEVRGKGADAARSEAPATPDFKALRAEAEATGKEMSTTNDWGLEDAFYTEQLEPAFDDLKDSRAEETYSDTPEYDDLACFLDIADACGIQTLVVVSPVMGPYYDHIGISESVRTACYDRIRSIVANHPSAKIADFSDKEYEKYFLFDIVHFGWTGWIDVEQAIYNFAKDDA